MYFILLHLLVVVFTQDCILTSTVSVYECSAKCEITYGKNPQTQRLFYNKTSMYCMPKVDCPQGWTYIDTSNTCVNDLGQRRNIINGAVLSSNVQNFTYIYMSCNNGNFANASCFCDPGWGSSKTEKVIGKNTTTLQFCDVQMDGTNLKASKGQNIFNGYSWGQKRAALGEVFEEGERWISPLVVVSLIIYCLMIFFSLHNWIMSLFKVKVKVKVKGKGDIDIKGKVKDINLQKERVYV